MPTQLRQIRMGDLWDEAREVAQQYDLSTSEFIRVAIGHLIDDPDRDAVIAEFAAVPA